MASPHAVDLFPTKNTGPLRPPLAYVDVYVDDFIKLAQGWLNTFRVQRHTYHHIDGVFRPNDLADVDQKSSIFVKMLEKVNDFWATEKIILGWLINTLAKPISLPPHHKECLHQLLDTMLWQKRASQQEWQCLLRELRSMQ